MPLDREALMDLVCGLSREEQLKVAISESIKGGMMVGGIAAVGGLLAGPAGLAIGGAIGGCVAAISSNGKFKPVAQVLLEMPLNKRKELLDRVQRIIDGFDMYDLASAMLFLSGNVGVKKQIINVIINYIQRELHMQIVD